MSEEIFKEMLEIVKMADWMDTNSKAKAFEKAANINKKIGYPDYYDNLTYIESSNQVVSIYKDVNI